MKIRLSQIRSTPLSSPPSNPLTDELYLDDGTNTQSGVMGWRMYRSGAWEDVGLQDVSDATIDGGTWV